MYAAVTNPPDMCYPLSFAKHFQHALSHGKTTENINAGDQHRDKAQEADPAAVAYLQQRANHDNARNGIGHRHQRRMQRMGDVPHHVVTHHAGQREDGEMAEELFGATLASQPKRIIASAISAYLRHGDAGFTASFGASTFFAAACG